MGKTSIAKDLMESQKEEIITFLKKKRYNVNKASLEKAQKSLNSNKPEPFFMPKMTEAGLDFEKYESYKHFLVDSSVRSLDAMPLTVYAPNLGEIGNKNKYLTFAEQQEKPKKKGKAKEELVTLPTVSIGEILGTEEEVSTEVAPQDKIAELRAKEEEEVKKIIPNIDDYKVDGVINKDKVLADIKDEEVKEQYNEIYDRYNKLITEAAKGTTEVSVDAPVTDLEKIQEQYYKDRKVSGYSKLNHATPEEFLKHLKTTAKGTDGKAKLAQVALEELQKLETKEELPSLEGVQALEDILPSVTVSEADRAEAIAGFDNFFGEPAGVSTTTLAEAKEAEENCNGIVG
jgi:hypothetical protein